MTGACPDEGPQDVPAADATALLAAPECPLHFGVFLVRHAAVPPRKTSHPVASAVTFAVSRVREP